MLPTKSQSSAAISPAPPPCPFTSQPTPGLMPSQWHTPTPVCNQIMMGPRQWFRLATFGGSKLLCLGSSHPCEATEWAKDIQLALPSCCEWLPEHHCVVPNTDFHTAHFPSRHHLLEKMSQPQTVGTSSHNSCPMRPPASSTSCVAREQRGRHYSRADFLLLPGFWGSRMFLHKYGRLVLL